MQLPFLWAKLPNSEAIINSPALIKIWTLQIRAQTTPIETSSFDTPRALQHNQRLAMESQPLLERLWLCPWASLLLVWSGSTGSITSFLSKLMKGPLKKQDDSSSLLSLELSEAVKPLCFFFFPPHSNNVNIPEWDYKKRRLRILKKRSQLTSRANKWFPLDQVMIMLMAYPKYWDKVANIVSYKG